MPSKFVAVDEFTSKEGRQIHSLSSKYLQKILSLPIATLQRAKKEEIVAFAKDWAGKFFYIERGSFIIANRVFSAGEFVHTQNLVDVAKYKKEEKEQLKDIVSTDNTKYLSFPVSEFRVFLSTSPKIAFKFFRMVAEVRARHWMEVSLLYVSADGEAQQTDKLTTSSDNLTLEQINEFFISSFGIFNEPILYRKNFFFLKLISLKVFVGKQISVGVTLGRCSLL